ncbi:MAG TPA: nuclear transport factor 2 family protein [Anaerolineales bacterium]|nr:nuclear transport factor 2 family protein [Anaerolineales bacterium]
MNEREKESLVQRYVRAYNDFNIDGMMALMHPECRFQNVSGGEVNASTTGVQQLRELAEKSKDLFSARRQTITAYQHDGESLSVEIDYEGVLRVDIPNGPKVGETLKLKGRSDFQFRDGLIYALTDYS